MKKTALLCVLVLFSGIIFASEAAVKAPKGKIISFISHEKYSEKEYFETKKIFEKAGYEVVTVANIKTKTTGVDYDGIKPDLTTKDIHYSTDYDAIVLIGGEGAMEQIWNNLQLLHIINNFYLNKKVTAAISLSPVALGQAGALAGIKAAVNKNNGAPDMIKASGAKYVKSGVVTSGLSVTAANTSDAAKFARAVLALIKQNKKEN